MAEATTNPTAGDTVTDEIDSVINRLLAASPEDNPLTEQYGHALFDAATTEAYSTELITVYKALGTYFAAARRIGVLHEAVVGVDAILDVMKFVTNLNESSYKN